MCCVLTVHNILYRFDNTQRDGLSLKKKVNIFIYLKASCGNVKEKAMSVTIGSLGSLSTSCHKYEYRKGFR